MAAKKVELVKINDIETTSEYVQADVVDQRVAELEADGYDIIVVKN